MSEFDIVMVELENARMEERSKRERETKTPSPENPKPPSKEIQIQSKEGQTTLYYTLRWMQEQGELLALRQALDKRIKEYEGKTGEKGEIW